MDTLFYCQSCDGPITVNQLATLDAGKCPKCGSIEGFSSVSKSENDPFETIKIINDIELLEKTFEGKE